jgi:hypothetical protein
VEPVQAPRPHPLRDRGATEAGLHQLRRRHHSVLGGGNLAIAWSTGLPLRTTVGKGAPRSLSPPQGLRVSCLGPDRQSIGTGRPWTAPTLVAQTRASS